MQFKAIERNAAAASSFFSLEREESRFQYALSNGFNVDD